MKHETTEEPRAEKNQSWQPHHVANRFGDASSDVVHTAASLWTPSKAQQLCQGIGDTITKASFPKLTSPFLGWVASSFMASIITLDVGSLWIPRIGVSLARGAKPYDPQKDTDLQSRPLSQRVLLSKWRQLKALNWPNFSEESQREFATGPGVLFVPTASYFLLRRKLPAGDATFMPYETLKAYKHTYHHFLAQRPEQPWQKASVPLSERIQNNREDFAHFLQQHLRPDAHKALLAHPVRLSHEPQKTTTLARLLTQWETRLLTLHEGHLKHHLKRPLDLQGHPHFKAWTAAQEATLDTLATHIAEATKKVNEASRTTTHLWQKDLLPTLWHKPSLKPVGEGLSASVPLIKELPVETVLRELKLFPAYVQRLALDTVAKTSASHPSLTGFVKPLSEVSNASLIQTSETLYQKMLGHKLGFSLANTALGVGWLFWLASWVLKTSHVYPANRLMRIDHLKAGMEGTGNVSEALPALEASDTSRGSFRQAVAKPSAVTPPDKSSQDKPRQDKSKEVKREASSSTSVQVPASSSLMPRFMPNIASASLFSDTTVLTTERGSC
jgi:hypothetical protein